MTVPYRKFSVFKHYLDDDLIGNGLNKGDHSAVFSAHCYLGYSKAGGGAWDHWWWGAGIPTDSWALVEGANAVIDFAWTFLSSLIANTTANAHFHLRSKTSIRSNAENVDPDVATGQVYKAGGDWTSYPAFGSGGDGGDALQIDLADLPKSYTLYGESFAGGAPTSFNNQAYYFRCGFADRMHDLDAGDPAAGQLIKVELVFSSVKVRVHNPVVNALSKNTFLPAGGEPLVLSGFGFACSDAELQAGNPNNALPAGGWDSWVTTIEIINTSTAAVVATLEEASGDFVRDSDEQITIAAMPALTQGTYWLRLLKKGAQLNGVLPAGTNPSAYAGDWRADAGGEMTAGDRFVIAVGYTPGDIVVVTDWEGFEDHFAPIDTCAPSVFYDGRILNLSSYARGVSSGSGLFTASDMTAVLANTDRYLSILLFDHLLKDSFVSIYYAWQNAPAALKGIVVKLVVDDFDLKGPEFSAALRDVSSAYFAKQLPLQRCTVDEFANIHPNAIARVKPEILGKYEYSSGAIEAVYVDTTTFTYLAAAGHLHAITAVYGDGVAYDPADYTVSYDGSDQTLITFDADQGVKRITFDCEGYDDVTDWNSANGFVENPAYILGYFLLYFALIPSDLVDSFSIESLAAKYVTIGIDESGKFAMTKEDAAENYFRSLLYTYGALAAQDIQGRWWVERKDLTDLTADLRIFAQIDTLDHPTRKFNTASAYNALRCRWDWVPAADVYQGGEEFTDAASIADLKARIEPSFNPDFPWIDSAVWVAARATEDLLKYSYGYNSFIFSLSLDWIDEIELLDNLRLQDPYGVSATGAGEAGHLLFVDQLEIDFGGRTIRVTCRDLSYLE